jgi:putative colanic acid biosynthesis acetyltransferase WcaF
MTVPTDPNLPAIDPAIRSQSPWTTKDRIRRLLWGMVESTLFRCSPHPAYAWRRLLLRAFGAKLTGSVRIRRTVHIEIPWNLTVGENTAIGDHAILYCLGPVTIGRSVTISQYAHLCAGTHDYRSPAMTLLKPPIVIGDDVWIATDAFVGPGVSVGDRAVLGARSSAFSDLPASMICVGSPAKPIKPREAPMLPS